MLASTRIVSMLSVMKLWHSSMMTMGSGALLRILDVFPAKRDPLKHRDQKPTEGDALVFPECAFAQIEKDDFFGIDLFRKIDGAPAAREFRECAGVEDVLKLCEDRTFGRFVSVGAELRLKEASAASS